MHTTWLRIAGFCAFVTFSSAANTTASALEIDRPSAIRALQRIQSVNLVVQASGNSNCPVTESWLRDLVVNKIVPAGMVVDRRSPYWLIVESNSIRTSPQNCATSVDFYSGVITDGEVLFDKDRPQTHVIGFVSIIKTGGLYWYSTNEFLRFSEGLKGQIDPHVALWREANAGADFVRAPPVSTSSSPPNFRLIQQRLHALGLYRGSIDGISGPGTQAAIQQFQRQNQLPATGEPDPETMRRLFP